MLKSAGKTIEPWNGEHAPEVGNLASVGEIYREGLTGNVSRIIGNGLVEVQWFYRKNRRRRARQENKSHSAVIRILHTERLPERVPEEPRTHQYEGAAFGVVERTCPQCRREFVPSEDHPFAVLCLDCKTAQLEEDGMTYDEYINLGADVDDGESAYDQFCSPEMLKTNGVF